MRLDVKRAFIGLAWLVSACVSVYALDFIGSTKPVMTITPDKTTGLNAIYVVYNTDGVSLRYESKYGRSDVTWYKYSTQGGAYAEVISDIQRDGTTSTLMQVIPNMGYYIEDGTDRYYFWVVNYADYALSLNSVSVSPNSDCEWLVLDIASSHSGAIYYYSILGKQMVLSRDITISYDTQTADEQNMVYNRETKSITREYLNSTEQMSAPLCTTDITIRGDRFLEYWSQTQTMTYSNYSPQAVQVRSKAVATDETIPTQGDNTVTFSGSAPFEVTFTGIVSDGCTHYEWQFAHDKDFTDMLYRFTDDKERTYTFNEAGTFYVRFMGADASNTCINYGTEDTDGKGALKSNVYVVNIGESELKIPNVFSPLYQDGINDVWKVRYKSLVEFDCRIYNKQGIELCHFTNPDEGWDGRYGGKFVPTGAYYYVIIARGADSKVYKKAGDINIISYKKSSSSSEQGE